MRTPFWNPLAIFRHYIHHVHLIRQLTVRALKSRYKGSFFGLFWTILQPLLMLGVYTFVFSVIFEAKWGGDTSGGRLAYAMALFVGMLTFNIIGESAGQAPSLIIAHGNFVKKVVFPLEILPLANTAVTLFQSFIGLCILIVGQLLIYQTIHWSLILLLPIWLAVFLFALGCTYFLSALGVFIRDIEASISFIVTMLFFLSPIFYPLDAVPDELKGFVQANPIAVFVESARRVVLWGQMPEWPLFFGVMLLSILVFVMGFLWFMKSKRAFADVM